MRGAFAILAGVLAVAGCSEPPATRAPAPEIAERAFQGVRFRVPVPKDACHVDGNGYLMVVDAGDPTGTLPPSCRPAPFRYMIVDLEGEKPVVLGPGGPGAMDWAQVDCAKLLSPFRDPGSEFSLHESRLVNMPNSPALKCFATADHGVVAFQGAGDPRRRDIAFVYRGTVVRAFWTEPSDEPDLARLTAVTSAVQTKLNEWSQTRG